MLTDVKCAHYIITDNSKPSAVTTVTYKRDGIEMSGRWPGHITEEYARFSLNVHDQRFKDQQLKYAKEISK